MGEGTNKNLKGVYMNKKQLISAIRKAIREKDVTQACKLVPERTFSAKYNWVKEKRR